VRPRTLRRQQLNRLDTRSASLRAARRLAGTRVSKLRHVSTSPAPGVQGSAGISSNAVAGLVKRLGARGFLTLLLSIRAGNWDEPGRSVGGPRIIDLDLVWMHGWKSLTSPA